MQFSSKTSGLDFISNKALKTTNSKICTSFNKLFNFTLQFRKLPKDLTNNL